MSGSNQRFVWLAGSRRCFTCCKGLLSRRFVNVQSDWVIDLNQPTDYQNRWWELFRFDTAKLSSAKIPTIIMMNQFCRAGKTTFAEVSWLISRRKKMLVLYWLRQIFIVQQVAENTWTTNRCSCLCTWNRSACCWNCSPRFGASAGNYNDYVLIDTAGAFTNRWTSYEWASWC